MKLNKKLKDKKGFTLVELLVVIGILAIVSVPALFKNINKVKAADYKYIPPTEENNMVITTFSTNNISDKLKKIIENDANGQISVGTDNKTITIISNTTGLNTK